MSVPQVARKIVTAIPGPKSQALEEEHHRYVSAGVGQGMPVFSPRPQAAPPSPTWTATASSTLPPASP